MISSILLIFVREFVHVMKYDSEVEISNMIWEILKEKWPKSIYIFISNTICNYLWNFNNLNKDFIYNTNLYIKTKYNYLCYVLIHI